MKPWPTTVIVTAAAMAKGTSSANATTVATHFAEVAGRRERGERRKMPFHACPDEVKRRKAAGKGPHSVWAQTSVAARAKRWGKRSALEHQKLGTYF